MYPHLIEAHDIDDGIPFTVNIDHIINFYADEDGETVLGLTDGKWNCKESYEEIKTLIFDAGCLIAKKDPRLDDKPLTMEIICSMVGQPVYNSNSRIWGLVKAYDGQVLILYWDDRMEWLSERDLEKFPLYRMKVPE